MSSFNFPLSLSGCLIQPPQGAPPSQFNYSDKLLVKRLGQAVCDASGRVTTLAQVIIFGWSVDMSEFVYVLETIAPAEERIVIVETETHLRKPAFKIGNILRIRKELGPLRIWGVKEVMFSGDQFHYRCAPNNNKGDEIIEQGLLLSFLPESAQRRVGGEVAGQPAENQ